MRFRRDEYSEHAWAVYRSIGHAAAMHHRPRARWRVIVDRNVRKFAGGDLLRGGQSACGTSAAFFGAELRAQAPRGSFEHRAPVLGGLQFGDSFFEEASCPLELRV